MANWHGYWGIENLALSGENRNILIAELQSLGPLEDDQPARLNHWCTRLDNEAAIFEALWDTDTISIASFKTRLGALYGIAPVNIDHAVIYVVFKEKNSAVVTFSYNAIDYIRVTFFGYNGNDFPPTLESRAEAHQYLLDRVNEWNPPD